MSISSINADAFVSEVLDGAQVWGIKDKDGFPTSTNASGETAMPFWSSEKRASSVIQSVPAYRDFKPVPIALSEFIKRWLPGLITDGLYCGLNWSGKRATGYDLLPTDVLARLTANEEEF
ncbi:hypothetical protein CO670_26215 [Rhizobium sp. J15]|uniref:DUF2750 domain-containing protein n=1 Tax=Rhizobium sp. J15 TaxID=2035450 RepID=UPI000BE87C38|nr:DUF2750 domain-containing protein [Rhizobium sp. J15]PDT13838.1 hypothetical protein CO670_26215 [Rhizobium sp. J15]